VNGSSTEDNPAVTLHTHMCFNEANNFMIIRVADIWSYYKEWQKKGAEFLTEPKEHELETRCYMRDPDGYPIEVGQTR